MLLSGGRSVSMLLTTTYLGVQRVQGLGDPARSSLPGCGAAHSGNAIAGPHQFPFSRGGEGE